MTENNNVTHLPGAAFNPQTTGNYDPKIALNSALETPLVDVVIVGRDHSGELVVWSSSSNSDAVIGILHRGIAWLSKLTQVPFDDEEDVE